MAANAKVTLYTTTLTGTASSVSISSISQAYAHLELVVNYIDSGGGNHRLTVNGDTTSSYYSNTTLNGNGSSAASGRYTSQSFIYTDYWGGSATNGATLFAKFMRYADTAINKNILIRQNSSGEVNAIAGYWRNTAAINSITISAPGSNFSAGTTVSLYGIATNNIYTPSTIPSTLAVGDQIYVSYTGSSQTISIPAGVSTCRLDVFGARGGSNSGGAGNSGGFGGFASGVYSLAGAATTMYAYVGNKGTSVTGTGSGTLAGGFNGGGNGRYASNSSGANYAGAGGGGATDFRVGGTALSNRIIVAGGGGGESGSGVGGVGGGTTGGNATPSSYGTYNGQGGLGGSASAGGSGGQGSGSGNGVAGTLGVGGDGGNDGGNYGQGGGAGGGYYGGGGGGGHSNGNGGAGGGGSSWVGTLANTATASGVNGNNGYAVITVLS